MKVVINASNLKVGGGVQVAVSFINEVSKLNHGVDLHFITSEVVFNQLDQSSKNNSTVIKSPVGIFGWQARMALDRLTRGSDVVFSVFGPTYWRPKCKHIVGFANPWIVYDKKDVLSLVSNFKSVLLRIKYRIYRYFFMFHSDEFIVETDDVKKNLSLLTDKPIYTVANCASAVFLDNTKWEPISFDIDPSYLYLLCLGNNYLHKNYDFSGKVAEESRRLGKNVKFIFTLPIDSYKSLSELTKDNSINVGVVRSVNCPDLYAKADMLFLPTLLECYSANYPEAMISRTPIATSDRSFSRQICGSHAIYFDPKDPCHAAQQILAYFEMSEDKKEHHLDQAYKAALNSPSARERAREYLEIIKNSVPRT